MYTSLPVKWRLAHVTGILVEDGCALVGPDWGEKRVAAGWPGLGRGREVAGTFGEMSIEQEENKMEKNRNAGSKRCVVKVFSS